MLLEIDDCSLRIFTIFHEPLCEHRLSSGKGILFQNTNYLQDSSTAFDQLKQDLDEQLNHAATKFLCKVRADKPRYGREQFGYGIVYSPYNLDETYLRDLNVGNSLW